MPTLSFLFVSLFASANAAAHFRGSMVEQASHAVVAETLADDLVDTQHHLSALESELQQMFTALPKNKNGKLDHRTVRTALRRHFGYRYGWIINGLESNAQDSVLQDLQSTFEQRVGEQGASLHDLAALVATLDDLVSKEATNQLTYSYKLENLAVDKPLPRSEAYQGLYLNFMTFALEHKFNLSSSRALRHQKEEFREEYSGYAENVAWLNSMIDRHVSKEEGALVSFDDAAKVAMDITREFHNFNNQECKDLKAALQKFESGKPGRLRLSTFYNMSNNSHWRFVEKVEYLRAMGCLDESDPTTPYVIMLNYVMGRPNCMKSSNIFAICCQSSCEDLRSHVEREAGGTSAKPERIHAIFADMPLSVGGPPDAQKQDAALGQSLLSRLHEIANIQNGQVMLGSRLFAQWMHHAYPLECAQPVGSTYDPVVIEEFATTGGAATPEEMYKHVHEDTCMVNEEGKPACGETAILPWSLEEDVYDEQVREESASAESFGSFAKLVLLFGVFAGMLRWASLQNNEFAAKLRVQLPRQATKLALLVVASLAYIAGLLNVKILAIAILGSVGGVVASVRADTADKWVLPKQI